jgi:hypothetical protein
LKYVIWDVPSNKEISLQLQDIVSIQLFLSTDHNQASSLELSSSKLVFNKNRVNLIHLIEKNTYKMLSFHQDTFNNLIFAKYIFLFSGIRIDLIDKSNDVVNILKNIVSEKQIEDNQLYDFYEKIIHKMVMPDRLFLGELMFKFPTTLLTVVNIVKK